MDSNYITWLAVIFLLFIIPALNAKKLAAYRRRKIRAKMREKKGRIYMSEMLQRYLGKDCIIYCGNSFSESVDGVIEEISDEWVSINVKGNVQIVKIEYISRIREFPLNSKGKRASIY